MGTQISIFIQQIINGLKIGSVYALVALGYTMVYGIIKLINFAHGDFIMVGSYVLLYRAVYNLVENAIKYNKPQGTVTLSIQQKGQDVLLSVKDTGIGISLENQDKIFDPFFRVDKSRSRAMGGAGLGLALVDAIAREHHGQVKVLSSSSDGTIIGLSLPVASM